jgi:hypothetical protein
VCGKAARAALGNLGEHVSRDCAHVMAARTSTAPAKLDRPARLRQKERLEVWIQTEHQNRAGSEIHRFVLGTGLPSPLQRLRTQYVDLFVEPIGDASVHATYYFLKSPLAKIARVLRGINLAPERTKPTLTSHRTRQCCCTSGSSHSQLSNAAKRRCECLLRS